MFATIANAITSFLQQHNNHPLGIVLLAFSAWLEYVFPPFPGDVISLFGAFVVVRHGWSFWLVLAALTVGGVAGAMAVFWFGGRAAERYHRGRLFRRERSRRYVERALASMRRYGAAYVVLNRFLPGVRAVIFVAAGMAGLKGRWVLFYALVSATLWNALLFALAYALGGNWARISSALALYGQVAWICLAVGVVSWLAYVLLRRRSRG